MEFKADIGVIGALEAEVKEIISRLANHRTEVVGSIEFNLGELGEKKVVVARCGVGKVFAAICPPPSCKFGCRRSSRQEPSSLGYSFCR